MKRKLLTAVSAAALSLSLLSVAPSFAAGLDDTASHGLAMLGVQVPDGVSLSTEQVTQIVNVLGTKDADSNKRAAIYAIMGVDSNSGNTRPGVGQLRDSVTADLAGLGLDTSDVDSLTLTQLAQIENVNASNVTNESKKMKIAEILGNEATATGRLGARQLKDSTAADLASLGIDAEQLDSVTLSQLAQIENVMSSSESDDQKRNQINTILAE